MKFVIGIAASLAVVVVDGRDLVVPLRLNPENGLPNDAFLCEGGRDWLPFLTRNAFQKECGESAENPCPVFTLQGTDQSAGGGTDYTGLPEAECNSVVEIQTTGFGPPQYIHGAVAGYLSELIPAANSAFALAYGAYSLVCPYPCVDESGEFDVISCANSPTACGDGFQFKPRSVTDATDGSVIANYLVTQYGQLSMNFVFADSNSQIPPNGSVDDGNAVELRTVVQHIEIDQGMETSCTTPTYEFTQAEALEACGVEGAVPCPLGAVAGDIFGTCYDEGSDGCVDITFWMEGLQDPLSAYCESTVCGGSFATRRFRLVNDSAGPVQLPIGAWRDMCPHQCRFDGSGDFESGVCAAEGSCKAVVPDGPLTGTWQYSVPGSVTAKMVFMSAEPVGCADATTTTSTGSTTSTTPGGGSTTGEATSDSYRAAVGGLTALFVACGVLYNL